MKVYLCDKSVEGLLTAIFYSYYNKELVRICSELGGVGALDEAVDIPTEWARAERVMEAIRKYDPSAPAGIAMVLCLDNDMRFEIIHRYLRLLFAERRSLREFNHVPEVREVFNIVSDVEREISRLRGAMRFRTTLDEVMYAQFASEFDLMGVLLPRLAAAFRTERIMLHDLPRNKLGIYSGNSAHARLDVGEYNHSDLYKSKVGKGADYYYVASAEPPEPLLQEEFYRTTWQDYMETVSVPRAETKGYRAVRFRWK